MIYDTRPFLEMVPKVRDSLKAESARRQGGGLGGSGTIEQLEYMVNELDRAGGAEIRKGSAARRDESVGVRAHRRRLVALHG